MNLLMYPTFDPFFKKLPGSIAKCLQNNNTLNQTINIKKTQLPRYIMKLLGKLALRPHYDPTTDELPTLCVMAFWPLTHGAHLFNTPHHNPEPRKELQKWKIKT